MSQTVEANPITQTNESEPRYSSDLLRMMAGSAMEAISYPASDDVIKGILRTKIHTAEDLLFESLTDNEAQKGEIRKFAIVPISGELPDSAKAAIAEIDSTISQDERVSMRQHAVAVFREYFGGQFHNIYDRLCAEIMTDDVATVAAIATEARISDTSGRVTTNEIDVLLSEAYSQAV